MLARRGWNGNRGALSARGIPVAGTSEMGPLAAGHGLVQREALFERLSAASPGGVVLVCAPAGSGKSVLVRSWAESRGWRDRTAWVPVQRGERDGQRFWLSVIDALSRVLGSVAQRGRAAGRPLPAKQPQGSGDRLRALHLGQHRTHAHSPHLRQTRRPPPQSSGGPCSRAGTARAVTVSPQRALICHVTREPRLSSRIGMPGHRGRRTGNDHHRAARIVHQLLARASEQHPHGWSPAPRSDDQEIDLAGQRDQLVDRRT